MSRIGDVSKSVTIATFGALIRSHREQLGLTKEQLAVATGRTQTLIGKLEREEFRTPDKPSGIAIGDKMLDKLASVLDIDRDELYRAYGKLPRDVLEYLVVTPGALDAVRERMNE